MNIWAQRATVLVSIALVGVGCSAPDRAQKVDGQSQGSAAAVTAVVPKRFTAAIRGYPKSVSPMIDGAGPGSTAGLREVDQLVNAGLTVLDGDGRLTPRLAEQAPSFENGHWKLHPDGRMETTWRIRSGAQWQDGVPFTAQDLVFTAQIAQDRQLAIVLDAFFDRVESVDALDPQTLTVRWKETFVHADALFSDLSSQAIMPMPRHLLEAPYAEDKTTFHTLPYWNEAFIGTGPFKVREFAVDSHLVLEANARYLLGRPKIDEIEVRFIGDFTVLVANVLAGAIEMNFGRGLSLEQGLQARDQWKEGRLDTSLDSITALFPQYLNPSPEVVADVRFRRALLHAVDRQQITDTLQAGLSPVAHNPIIPTDPIAGEVEDRLVRYPFDAVRARQLLAEIGYVRGADGFLRDPAGQRLTVKIQSTIDDLRQKTMAVIGDYWKDVGVALDPVIIPRQASADRQLRAEFASFDFTRQPTDPTRYHSVQSPLPENGYRGTNRGRYRNPELDSLLDKYVVTIPRPERTQILGQIVHHMTDRLVHMGIFYVVEAALISNRLKNVGSTKVEATLQTWNAHEWELSS